MLILFLLLGIPIVLSFSTSSENYEITGIIDSGGNVASSSNYKIESVLGEQILGASSSENYNVYLGFFNIIVEPFYDFRIWAESSPLFTIGEAKQVNIYIKNTGNMEDSYTLSYTKEAKDKELNDASHLINVDMPSNKIGPVEKARIGNTIATITLLGRIAEGTVTFTAVSDFDPTLEDSDTIRMRGGFPTSLPEFGPVGLILIIILAASLFV